MVIFEVLLGLLALSVVLALLARKLQVPSAVMLVLGGIAVAFVPGIPEIRLEPELALALFLPPLLQASAQRTDWQQFRSNLLPIMLLAIGAVVFTTAAVATAAKTVVPDLPWGAAIALGAIVAPPDAVSATSVLKGFRLPKRLVTVLEGESLINDASSLIIYRFAILAVAGAFSFREAFTAFLLSGLLGAAAGLAVGWLTALLLKRLQDRLLEILVSFLSAFASYFLAEAMHVSGVLAAVACGGLVGRRQLELAARTRLETNTAWELVEFVLTSLVFLLVGLQLRGILERLAGDMDAGRLAVLAAVVSGALILSRFVWVFATFYPVAAVGRAVRGQGFVPPLSWPTIVSWAGMRGVVSLAAALALPFDFPGRDVIVFLAFCAILATLVLQGTTLAPLIRRFDLVDPEIQTVSADVVTARKEVAAAAMSALSEKLEDPEHADVAETLVQDFQSRVDHAELAHEDAGEAQRRMDAQLQLRLVALEAARSKLLERRDELDGDTLSTLVQELDLEEEQVRVAMEAS